MRFKPIKLIAGGILALLLTASAFGQNPRTGTLLGNNSTPATILTAVADKDDTSEVFYLATGYDAANFTFRRVRAAIGTAGGDNDSDTCKFLLQGSYTGDFYAGRSFLIDSTALIANATDTVYTTAGDFLGVSGTSIIFDQLEGAANIPWHRGFPYIRFIFDGRGSTAVPDDTISYKIDYVLSRKPQ